MTQADVLRPGRILIADDDEEVRDLFRALLARDGYIIQTAADGLEALEMVGREPPDVVLSDVMMPGVDGFELCRRLKDDPATRLIPVVLVTGLAERNDRLRGINAGADDFLTKPADAHQLMARVRSLLKLKRFTDELDSAESVILRLALTVEGRHGTAGHCQRMAAYAAAFGVHLDLSPEDVASLHRGGYLHDIGKVGIPDAILAKAGGLSPEEHRLMTQHTVIGAALCGDLRILRPVRPIVRHHHELYDGTGYPDGLAGNAIPLLAQIMGIVDAYEALTTRRPYRPAAEHEVAYAELQEEARKGRRRADLIDAFVALCRTGRMKTLAETGPGPKPLIGAA